MKPVLVPASVIAYASSAMPLPAHHQDLYRVDIPFPAPSHVEEHSIEWTCSILNYLLDLFDQALNTAEGVSGGLL
jgi:hypothetical protein